jgi:tRNA G18 (ribose-2'-O)-methylase SpoU
MRAPSVSCGNFGIGVEGVSKPMNLGALLRTAHTFGVKRRMRRV